MPRPIASSMYFVRSSSSINRSLGVGEPGLASGDLPDVITPDTIGEAKAAVRAAAAQLAAALGVEMPEADDPSEALRLLWAENRKRGQ